MQKITPFLWFDDNLEEAMSFYQTVFKNTEMGDIQRMPDGKVQTAQFRIENQEFMGLNGGPNYTFNEAVSFFVTCEDQAEVDEYWDKLTADGGVESQCGWLKDKFGVSWQIIPKALGEALSDPDPAKALYAMNAMLKMRKIVAADLRED